MLPRLDADGLTLDPLGRGDLAWLHGLLVQPGVRRFLCDDRVLPEARVARLLDENLARAGAGLGLWAIRQGGGQIGGQIGERLGIVALQPVPEDGPAPALAGAVEPVIALADAHARQGHGTRALAAAMRHAFATLRLPRLVALADLPNAASHALLCRAGFRVTGQVAGAVHPIRTYEARAPEEEP